MERPTGQSEYRPRIATIFVAAFLGGAAAAIGVNRFLDMRRQVDHPAVECEPIFVATREIAAGDPVTVWDVSLKDWPKATAPADALRIDDSLEGRFALRSVREGQPLVRSSIGRQATPSAIEPAGTQEEEAPFDLPEPPRPPERSTGREDPTPLAAPARPVTEPNAGPAGAGRTLTTVDPSAIVEAPRPTLSAVETPLASDRGMDPDEGDGTAEAAAASAVAAAGEGSTGGPATDDAMIPEAVTAAPVEVKNGILAAESSGVPPLAAEPMTVGAASGPPSARKRPFTDGFTNQLSDEPTSAVSSHSLAPADGEAPPSLQAITPRARDTAAPEPVAPETMSPLPQPVAPALVAADPERPVTAAPPATTAEPGSVAREAGDSKPADAREGGTTRTDLGQIESRPTEMGRTDGVPAPTLAAESVPTKTTESSQSPPLRFLVIPERIAALVDGPVATEADLRTIDSTDGLLPKTNRPAAPARSASTSLSGAAVAAPDRLPGSTVGSAAAPGGGSRRPPEAAPRRPVAPSGSGRGSTRPGVPSLQRIPSSGAQQPAPPRTGLRALFPNVSGGMSRIGSEIGERLRRTQQ